MGSHGLRILVHCAKARPALYEIPWAASNGAGWPAPKGDVWFLPSQLSPLFASKERSSLETGTSFWDDALGGEGRKRFSSRRLKTGLT